MNYVEIPLTTDPNQNFIITIPVDNKNITLSLFIRFNSIGNYWVMQVKDKSGNILIDSLPLITGDYPAGDLLGQYQYLNIGSATLIKTGSSAQDNPNSTNLGSDFILVWGDSA